MSKKTKALIAAGIAVALVVASKVAAHYGYPVEQEVVGLLRDIGALLTEILAGG